MKNKPSLLEVLVIIVYSFLAAILICAGGFLLMGCASTVIPKKVSPATASFDGNEQNSGIISLSAGCGAYITPHARDRYNFLIDKYGTRFVPALTHDAGVSLFPFNSTNTQYYYIDAEHLSKFATMNRWRHELK